MSTAQYLLNAGLLVFVLATNLGTRRLTWRRLALPVALVVAAGWAFLRDLSMLGNDARLELVGAGLGVALGVVAGALVAVRRDAGGLVTVAGSAYAGLWVAVIGGRVLFAYGADHWFTGAITAFSVKHRITGGEAWTAAFVLMALAMVLTRVLVTAARSVALDTASGGAGVTPVRRAVAALLALLVVATGCWAALAWRWPESSERARSLVAVSVLTVLVVGAVARSGCWRELGVNPPAQWRRLTLLVLPAVLALSPLLLGVRSLPVTTWAVLVAGYALTGVAEELLWRGLVLHWLRSLGTTRAVLLAAALFGAGHLANLLYRGSPGLVLAQCWGAFCFGVGYGALRERTGTLVPLVALHAVTDLAAAVGRVPALPVLVLQDVVLLVLGLTLLARHPSRRTLTRHAVAVPEGTR
ncbi:CPBP family intramembrane glutamic endopeptidase [uncultured Nocardioides sp.]|uniref:CPBP family intramembrane glutamic endopeptidase n=1 Tax=uncultured Nocardioides sp. TaxID=198441 RepID=UPI00261FF3E5|nr:CPBP family intramembrane glutamic endopeptidase [uncultured Nocardioides sp.]